MGSRLDEEQWSYRRSSWERRPGQETDGCSRKGGSRGGVGTGLAARRPCPPAAGRRPRRKGHRSGPCRGAGHRGSRNDGAAGPGRARGCRAGRSCQSRGRLSAQGQSRRPARFALSAGAGGRVAPVARPGRQGCEGSENAHGRRSQRSRKAGAAAVLPYVAGILEQDRTTAASTEGSCGDQGRLRQDACRAARSGKTIRVGANALAGPQHGGMVARQSAGGDRSAPRIVRYQASTELVSRIRPHAPSGVHQPGGRRQAQAALSQGESRYHVPRPGARTVWQRAPGVHSAVSERRNDLLCDGTESGA